MPSGPIGAIEAFTIDGFEDDRYAPGAGHALTGKILGGVLLGGAALAAEWAGGRAGKSCRRVASSSGRSSGEVRWGPAVGGQPVGNCREGRRIHVVHQPCRGKSSGIEMSDVTRCGGK